MEPGQEIPAPRLLRLTGDAVISHAEEFYRELTFIINPGLAKKLYPWPGTQVEGGGMSDICTGDHLDVKRPDPSMPLPRTMQNLNRNLSSWDAPVVMSIDETQNIGKTDAVTTRGILQEIHDNLNDLPVMLVLAGLGDTIDNAMEFGLSRPAQRTTWTLGRFDRDETEDLIFGWGRRYGLPDGKWQVMMNNIAEDCYHFPVHVQNALMSLAEEVVAAGG